MTISFSLNGRDVTLNPDDPVMPLLYALRDDFELHGPRFGCGLAQCGACTVLLEDAAIRSCVTPISVVAGQRVTTLEGLGTPEKLHPLQQAFIQEQAAQCGYCINGMIMQAAGLLHGTRNPSDAQIKSALAGNLCRCGTHLRILRAVKTAVAKIANQAGNAHARG
jgi:nicotinate dehydrogenase subunit A